jgi:hypothetical protein
MKQTNAIMAVILTAFIFLFIGVEFLLNLTPPIARDAIIHHLAIPKLWIQNGGFFETPWADFSYYPLYVNLLYVIPLMFNNYILPSFIHMAFGIATGVLVFFYLRERYGSIWGILGFSIFFTTPIVIWLSTSAYIDLGMTFFTTASLLSFVRWKESGYKKNLWLMISGIAMGFAVGSKYNALLAWLITNLLIIAIYAREEKKQLAAIQYGLFFFIITGIVACPWYIKNFILTGNPFFPLFNSLFSAINSHVPMSEMVKRGLEKPSGGVGFFQLRGYMYGESFLETLAIPLRMFFQGDDNSYQYFQGRLNPILIVFLPFAFFSPKDRKNLFLFLTFSVFFMVMAFFLTEKQVRYQLPVVPLLTIIGVSGIKNILDFFNKERIGVWKHHGIAKILTGFLIFSVGVLLFQNMQYLKERMDIIKPLPYVLGKESKDDFLQRHLGHYYAVRFINENLPQDARVFTIFFGRRGYYLDRAYFNHRDFGTSVIRNWAIQSVDEKKFIQAVKSFGATHIAMRTDLVDQFLSNNFKPEEINRFITMVKKHWIILYKKNAYAVWDIRK